MNDLASAMTDSVAADGQTPMTGPLNMNSNKVTNLATGTISGDGVNFAQFNTPTFGGAVVCSSTLLVTGATTITGGAIDGTTIGTTTRSTVKATTLDLGLSTQSVAIGQGDSSSIKNRIINGAMVIDQRNAGVSVTPLDGAYTLDRWKVGASVASKFSVQQNAGSVTPPAGFKNYLGVTSLSAYSVPAGEAYNIYQPIEGFNTSDLDFGSASAKTVTLSFWVRSSLTGTFGGSINNSAQNRSYPFSYTISVADTWEQKSVTIAGDTSGTWIGATNGVGLYLWIGLGVGSTFSGTAGAWAASNFRSATGATSVVGTNGATFYITGVQLEVGSQATGFEYRQYGTELALCQRYCAAFSSVGSSSVGLGAAANASTGQILIALPVAGRVPPTGIVSSASWIFGNYNAGDGGTGAIVFANATASSITVNSAGGGSGMTAGFAGILYSSSGTSTFYTTGQEL
jgi:hypothetical protein